VGGKLDGEAVRRSARAQRAEVPGDSAAGHGGGGGRRGPPPRLDSARAGGVRGATRGHGGVSGAGPYLPPAAPPPPAEPRSDRHRRVRGGAAAGGRDERGSEETEGKERRREARRKRAGTKQSFYLTSHVKMNCLLDAVCGRPNDAFAVCWEQIRV